MKEIKKHINDHVDDNNISSISTCDEENLKSELRAQTVRKITSSKANAIAFLQKAGICDEKGNLTPMYR
jgi:hypothetical protein